MRVRGTAGAAGHASQTLSTLSERTAISHAQRSECHTFSTTTLAVSGTALAGWCGEGWWECTRSRWRGWACMGELAGCGIWL
eukprot:3635923-Prymnesium_polylepis.1